MSTINTDSGHLTLHLDGDVSIHPHSYKLIETIHLEYGFAVVGTTVYCTCAGDTQVTLSCVESTAQIPRTQFGNFNS